VTAWLIAFSSSSVRADESALIPYLPEELRDLPSEIILLDDRCGYWAGLETPLVRYIELYRNHEAENRWLELELDEGVVMKDYNNSLLLFYYQGEDGSWRRIGHFSPYAVTSIWLRRPLFNPRAEKPIRGGLMGIAAGWESKSAFTRKAIVVEANLSGGNNYWEPSLRFFSFAPDVSDCVKLVDDSIHLTGVSIKELYDFVGDFKPEFIGYAGWQFWGDVCRAASPDRQLVFGLDKEDRLVNVSEWFPDFYLERLSASERGLHRQVEEGYARCFNDVRNDYYIGYVITTLIYYHDMGKHDEGVERARGLFAREYCANDDHYEAMQQLIDEAIEKLAEQDAEIQASIDEYNAVHVTRGTF
jgi:hypothetical protein